jgi:hypothetical protein
MYVADIESSSYSRESWLSTAPSDLGAWGGGLYVGRTVVAHGERYQKERERKGETTERRGTEVRTTVGE